MSRKTASRWLLIGAALSGLMFAAPSITQAAEPQPYTWSQIPFGGGGFVDGFVYHPKQKDVLYARTDVGGLYRFDATARRWLPLLQFLGHDDGDLMGVLSVAVDPNDPNKVYAACGLYLNQWSRAGAILRSDDQGRTWQKTDLPIHVGGNADGRGTGERLIVDPRDSNTLWYASNQDGLWKSSDGGKTFAKVSSPATSLSLAMADPSGQALYVGGADGKGGLFVSTDGGASFKPVEGTPDQVPQRAAFAADGTLYVSFAQGDGKAVVNPSNALAGSVWRRDPKSGQWSNVSPVKPDGNAKFGYSGVDVGPDGTVAVSTLNRWYPGDDIFVSKDGGAHWSALSQQSHHDASTWPWLVNYLHGEDRMGHWIADVKINPFNPDEMIYGTGYGLWMTHNLTGALSGQPVAFDFADAGLEETATLQMTSPIGGATVLAAFGDVGGAAWDDITKTPDAGLFKPNSENNNSVDYAGLNSDFVARVTTNDPTHGFYSEDAGADWTPFPSTPYKAPDGKSGWRGPGVLAVSAKGTSMLWAPEKDVTYYSSDKGKTWTASQGLPTGDQSFQPLSDKAVDGVYYVLDRSTMSILISVDGGQSFKPIIKGLPAIQSWEQMRLAVVPTRMRDLWVIGPFGLLHSRDAGTPMAQVKSVDTAWLIGFGAPKAQGGYPAVYLWGKIKGQEGLWRSDDEAQTWTRINDDAHRFGSFSAIAGDPLEYGTLYAAPGGQGLIVGKPQ